MLISTGLTVKCYCAECYDPETQPKVKSAGHPPEEYAIPIGWTSLDCGECSAVNTSVTYGYDTVYIAQGS